MVLLALCKLYMSIYLPIFFLMKKSRRDKTSGRSGRQMGEGRSFRISSTKDYSTVSSQGFSNENAALKQKGPHMPSRMLSDSNPISKTLEKYQKHEPSFPTRPSRPSLRFHSSHR